MINTIKLEIDKIYTKIDKIAKKGNDNYLEYYIYIDNLVNSGKYSYLVDVLNIKYSIDILNMNIPDVKSKSWKQILFKTNTSFQDSKMKLMKRKNVYQNGLFYYKEIPRTQAVVVDSVGSGADLLPVIDDGGVNSINVLKTGYNYSASASVVITGGVGTASATPIIRQGKVYLVNVTGTGSNHNQDIKLGTITEQDIYDTELNQTISKDLYQKISGNKTTRLIATKNGYTQSATFSSWNASYTYDKNLISLYNSALDYLLS
jgi:hypothetical protein